jgi:hypothetical protein
MTCKRSATKGNAMSIHSLGQASVALFGQTKITRQCNGCKECCYLFTVPAMDKAAKEWCKHCTDAGCGIHDQDRPPICVNYQCAYILSPDVIPGGLRPDKCGIIFRAIENIPIRGHGKINLLQAITGDESLFDRPEIVAFLAELVACGWAITGVVNGDPLRGLRRCVDRQRYPWVTDRLLTNLARIGTNHEATTLL